MMPDYSVLFPTGGSVVATDDGLRSLVSYAQNNGSVALWQPMRELLDTAKSLGYNVTEQ